MTDDAFQENTGLRTLPTDEINYVRNAVKATVDAYDGTVTLYEWDETDPILKAWRGAFPGTVKDRSEIPDALMEHLRYPEDLFKVQRYQYARYHVTDPSQWFQGNDRWAVPEDPNNNNNFQPPYRMFVNPPPGEGEEAPAAGAVDEQVWSLTSVFVPFDRRNLAAFVSVNSDATSEDYGQMRTVNVLDDQTQGPGQVANAMRSDSVAAGTLAEFNRSGNTVLYGNVLTLPVGGRLLNVEPVYVGALRQRRKLPDPALRAGLLQRERRASARPLSRRSVPPSGSIPPTPQTPTRPRAGRAGPGSGAGPGHRHARGADRATPRPGPGRVRRGRRGLRERRPRRLPGQGRGGPRPHRPGARDRRREQRHRHRGAHTVRGSLSRVATHADRVTKPVS